MEFRSLLPFSYASAADWPWTNMLVSSANNMKVPRLEAFDMSFMYKRNSKGPNTEPCGTPNLTINLSDFSPRTSVYCDLEDR